MKKGESGKNSLIKAYFSSMRPERYWYWQRCI